MSTPTPPDTRYRAELHGGIVAVAGGTQVESTPEGTMNGGSKRLSGLAKRFPLVMAAMVRLGTQ